MNTKIMVVLIVALVAALGAWFQYQQSTIDAEEADARYSAYGYLCDDGSGFVMVPAADAQSITITPGAGAPFQGGVFTAAYPATQPRYEGNGTTFVGIGEKAQITSGGRTLICNPIPNPDMAPFNWGDAQ